MEPENKEKEESPQKGEEKIKEVLEKTKLSQKEKKELLDSIRNTIEYDVIKKAIAVGTLLKEKTLSAEGEFKREIKKHVFTAINAAFAFIIALTWRDAIQSGVNKIVADISPKSGYLYNLWAAIIVTILCAAGIIIIAKLEGKKGSGEEKKEDH